MVWSLKGLNLFVSHEVVIDVSKREGLDHMYPPEISNLMRVLRYSGDEGKKTKRHHLTSGGFKTKRIKCTK